MGSLCSARCGGRGRTQTGRRTPRRLPPPHASTNGADPLRPRLARSELFEGRSACGRGSPGTANTGANGLAAKSAAVSGSANTVAYGIPASRAAVPVSVSTGADGIPASRAAVPVSVSTGAYGQGASRAANLPTTPVSDSTTSMRLWHRLTSGYFSRQEFNPTTQAIR
jgi:hypothetical protein